MSQTATAERRPDAGQTRREIRLPTSFKPVALPALAAAVQAVRGAPRRPQVHELPAILRKEAALG